MDNSRMQQSALGKMDGAGIRGSASRERLDRVGDWYERDVHSPSLQAQQRTDNAPVN